MMDKENIVKAIEELDTQSTSPEIARELGINDSLCWSLIQEALDAKLIEPYGLVQCSVTKSYLEAYKICKRCD